MEAVFVPCLSAIDHVEVLALYKTVEHSIDVDFIDHRSVLEAEIRDGRLEKQGEAYRIIILPEMRTVRIGVIRPLPFRHRPCRSPRPL